jgi:hypothetical protein
VPHHRFILTTITIRPDNHLHTDRYRRTVECQFSTRDTFQQQQAKRNLFIRQLKSGARSGFPIHPSFEKFNVQAFRARGGTDNRFRSHFCTIEVLAKPFMKPQLFYLNCLPTQLSFFFTFNSILIFSSTNPIANHVCSAFRCASFRASCCTSCAFDFVDCACFQR